MNVRRLVWSALALYVGFAGGCSRSVDDGRPARVPVTGQVFYKEQPVEGASVVFAPSDHHYPAYALTEKDGSFKLTTFDTADGAVPGKFTAIIGKAEILDEIKGTTRELLPRKYLSRKSNDLSANVAAEQQNHFTFQLKD